LSAVIFEQIGRFLSKSSCHSAGDNLVSRKGLEASSFPERLEGFYHPESLWKFEAKDLIIFGILGLKTLWFSEFLTLW